MYLRTMTMLMMLMVAGISGLGIVYEERKDGTTIGFDLEFRYNNHTETFAVRTTTSDYSTDDTDSFQLQASDGSAAGIGAYRGARIF